MTLPDEELWALKRTHEFLQEIIQMKLGDIRKNSRGLREKARVCLRHYPYDFILEKLWQPRIYRNKQDIAGIEDKDLKPIHKFNNGKGATLCHCCRVIISEGHTDALYCEECERGGCGD